MVKMDAKPNLFGGLPFRRNNLQHLLQEVENLVGESIYVVHAVLLDALPDVAFQIWRVQLHVHVFVSRQQFVSRPTVGDFECTHRPEFRMP